MTVPPRQGWTTTTPPIKTPPIKSVLLIPGAAQPPTGKGWCRRALAALDAVEPTAIASPDLMTGLAGVGVLALVAWQATGSERARLLAGRCWEILLGRVRGDRPVWALPEHFEGLGVQEYVGISHGTAGVGYLGAELALATGDHDVAEDCHQIAAWVVGRGRSSLAGGRGLSWRNLDSERPSGVNWCHGAPGISRFLLSAWTATKDHDLLAAAEAASRTTAATHWVGTTQCHGLAGNIESLLDLVGRSARPVRAEAAILGRNLMTFESPVGWPSDRPGVWCPDLMIGEAGVALAFARLANPSRPHALSPRAFARPAGP